MIITIRKIKSNRIFFFRRDALSPETELGRKSRDAKPVDFFPREMAQTFPNSRCTGLLSLIISFLFSLIAVSSFRLQYSFQAICAQGLNKYV